MIRPVEIYDLLRLVCLVLIVLIGFGFAGGTFPIGDSLAVFRPEQCALLAIFAAWAGWHRRGSTFWLSAATVVVAAVSIGRFADFNPPVGAPDFQVHQQNLLWSNDNIGEWADAVIAGQADVLTLQEYGPSNRRVAERLGAAFPDHQICIYPDFAVAVYGRLDGVRTDGGCAADVPLAWQRQAVNGQDVSFVSVHLKWPWPMSQKEQTDLLVEVLRDVPQPIVMAGDFNITPWASSIARLAETAAGRVAPGLSPTFFFDAGWPAIRIDNVIVPVAADVSVSRAPAFGSDHLGLVARIALP